MNNSIGHCLANQEVVQALVFAPMAFSTTKGHRGTLEASFSESVITNAFIESMHSLQLAARATTWKHRSFHLLRGAFFLSVMAHETYYFFPKAMHHWDKYSFDMERNSPQPVTALAHSVAAISVMMLFVKIILSQTRIFEPAVVKEESNNKPAQPKR